jgi:hypothetical protein
MLGNDVEKTKSTAKANKETAISEKRLGKHIPAETRSTQQYVYNGNGSVFYVARADDLQRRQFEQSSSSPCGGGVEYLHRNPASRRRRRKGKPRIWDSKMWSRLPQNSDPRSDCAGEVQKQL